MIDVSVIIPVYKAEAFIRQAVESVLDQPEVLEIILVEDHSPDNSLEVCKELVIEYSSVHLYQHPDGENHGEAASRNLAIQKSSGQYIAFLDADDIYLPGRFSLANKIFQEDGKIDGVYGALGELVESDAARDRWLASHRTVGHLTSMTEPVTPENLYYVLVAGRNGYFHLNSTVVRRCVFEKTGFFNTKLRLHTDIDMLWKISAVASMMPGNLLEPVALRRIHSQNTISTPRSAANVYDTWMLLLKEAWHWACKNITVQQRQVLLNRYLAYAEFSRLNKQLPEWTLILQKRFWLMVALCKDPFLAKEIAFWKRQIPYRIAARLP